MAVSSPVIPDLSGAYANIQRALTQRAEIASHDEGAMGAVAAIVKPLGEEAQARREALYKYSLQDHLNQNEQAYKAQAEGKSLTTQEDLEAHTQELGLNPAKVKGMIGKAGVWQTPEEKMNIGDRLQRQDTIEKMASAKENAGDTTGANLMRLFARSSGPEADQLIARINGMAQVESYIDPVTKTMRYRDKMTKMPLDLGGASTPTATPGGIEDLPTLRRTDQRQADVLEKLSKESATNPAFKTHANTLDELDKVEKLIKANVPGSQINIGADTAKAVGGVPGGRFTTLVSMQEGKDPSFTGKFGQGYQTLTGGNLSKNNQDLLLRETQVARSQEQAALAAAINEKHDQIKKREAPYASDNLIADQIGYQRYLSAPTASQPKQIDPQDPKTVAAVNFLVQNGKAVNAKNVGTVLADPKKYGLQ